MSQRKKKHGQLLAEFAICIGVFVCVIGIVVFGLICDFSELNSQTILMVVFPNAMPIFMGGLLLMVTGKILFNQSRSMGDGGAGTSAAENP